MLRGVSFANECSFLCGMECTGVVKPASRSPRFALRRWLDVGGVAVPVRRSHRSRRVVHRRLRVDRCGRVPQRGECHGELFLCNRGSGFDGLRRVDSIM